MPYIEQKRRPRFKQAARDLGNLAECAGDLNYIMTELVHAYIKKTGTKYQTYNDILGASLGCILELYRRQVSSYEDTKVEVNGDVGLNDIDLPEPPKKDL